MDTSFSVIMPTYNRKHCIKNAIDSLLSQTYQNFELIIIDDGSTDGTGEYLNKVYKNEIKNGKINYFQSPKNFGEASARNEGLKISKNKWIAYLDTDNEMLPEFLETFNYYISNNLGYKIFYAQIKNRNSSVIIGHKFDFDELVIGNFIDIGIFVHSIQLYRDLGGFDVKLDRLVDWDLIIKYTQKYQPVFIEKVLLNYDDGPDSSRISLSKSQDNNYKKIILKYIEKIPPERFTGEYLKYYTQIFLKDKEIEDKNQIIQFKSQEIQKKDQEVSIFKQLVQKKDLEIKQTVKQKDQEIQEKEKEIRIRYQDIDLTKAQLDSTKIELESTKIELNSRSRELSEVYRTRGWRLVVFVRRILDISIPGGSLRRKIAAFLFKCVRRIVRGTRLMKRLFVRLVHRELSFYYWSGLMSKIYRHARHKGMRQTIAKILARVLPRKGVLHRLTQLGIFSNSYNTNYYRWIQGVEQPFIEKLSVERETMLAALSCLPKISILMPTYNGDEIFFRKAVFSVINQWYSNWELCIVDDHSSHIAVKMVLDELRARGDSRIKIEERKENGGISLATNQAARLATGEFLAFLDHDDEIEPYALLLFVRELQKNNNIDASYSDCDKISINGYRYDPEFKPDWSPELLISVAYSSHFRIIRKRFFDKVGGLRKEFDGSQDYDLMLRITEYTQNVIHIPWVLYHWRAAPGSVALSSNEKPYAQSVGMRALQDAVLRRHIPGKAVLHRCANNNGVYKIAFDQNLIQDKITIIIPTKDALSVLRTCISSIQRLTKYPNYEIVVINNNSEKQETLDYFRANSFRVIDIPTESFNFSYINNKAVEMVDSEYIVFLNNDTEVINPDWLLELIGTMKIRDSIGVVGAKLLYPNNTVQHAGVAIVLDPDIIAHHAHLGISRDDNGFCGFAALLRNYSAVTAACMMVRKSIFVELGGFNENELAISYNDVDFCLRAVRAGYACVYNPDVLLYHHESFSKKRVSLPREIEYLVKMWKPIYPDHDPYINKHFEIRRIDYTLREK